MVSRHEIGLQIPWFLNFKLREDSLSALPVTTMTRCPLDITHTLLGYLQLRQYQPFTSQPAQGALDVRTRFILRSVTGKPPEYSSQHTFIHTIHWTVGTNITMFILWASLSWSNGVDLSVQNTGKSTRSQYGPAQCCGLMRDTRDTRDSGDGGWWSVGQKCWNAVTMWGDTVWTLYGHCMETLYTLYTGHLTAAPQYCQYPAEGRGWTHWPGMRWLPRPYWVQLPCGFGQPTLDTTQVG